MLEITLGNLLTLEKVLRIKKITKKLIKKIKNKPTILVSINYSDQNIFTVPG